MSIRKAIGAVKDQTSIGIAKVASNMAPDLEVAIVKATSHDEDPADEKYIREVVNFVSSSRGYVHASVAALSKRLSKTRDWVVAIKSLVLVHRLLSDADPMFQHEIMHATRKGTRPPPLGSQWPAKFSTGFLPLPKVVRKARVTNEYSPDAQAWSKLPSLPFWP
uniref:ENTH domain-containing protein n=1 Tax=Kalanchoe fedtschenkoi TaxID=63787 RepID=A0A7N0RA01_KALFE